MFDLDALLAGCGEAVKETAPSRAVREVLTGALQRPREVADVLGRGTAGLDILYNSPELTVLNVIWAPLMSIYPHDHRMWAVIGIYDGAEDNTLFRRGADGIVKSGGKELRQGDIFSLGADAIHVYGGDFVNQPRSQWDPDTLLEHPYDAAQVRRVFAEANAAWIAQVGEDLDEAAV